MSTVAAKNGIVAVDTSVIYQNAMFEMDNKIWRSKRTKSVFGFSGTLTWLPMFQEWYEAGSDMKRLPTNPVIDKSVDDGFGVLECRRDGDMVVWNYDFSNRARNEDYMALGAGSGFALGALAVGATARQAVAVAIKHDPYTGGKVRWMRASR